MTSKHGFTIVEIVLTATILALVSTPFLLALSNLGFRYRNLRHSYYAQLVAQKNIETMTNILQGANPTNEYTPTDNYFCTRISFTSATINCDSPAANPLMKQITSS